MFLKPDSVGIIPTGGYRIGDRQSVEALQWLAYIGRTRNNVSHAGNGREVRFAGVLNVKVDGYCDETNEVLSTSGAFGMGVFACPIGTKPLTRPRKLCRTGKRKLRRGCRELKTLVIRLFRSAGVSSENCCAKILFFKMNFARTPM